ncbi:IS21 family transposase [Reinekea blandensis]|nr:IS21 family transposase [Reinekea blandensis]
MQTQIYRDTLRLIHHSTMSNHAISKQLDVSPHTVKKCRRLSKKLQWNWEAIQSMNDKDLSSNFLKPRDVSQDKVMPDWVELHKLLQAKHQTRIELWEDYKETFKERGYSYSQFNFYYRAFLERIDRSMRLEHFAGETMQVDFAGTTIPYRLKNTSEQYAQIFVAVLPCSTYTFARAVPNQKLASWVEAITKALEFFGGVPQSIVPDNLKSAVTTPGLFPVINKTFQECADHYATVVLPTRPAKPQDKGKGENAVLHINRWVIAPLRRQQFFCIEEINEAIQEKLTTLNLRPFKRLPGNRYERFLEIDKPALKPLPAEPYEYAEWNCKLKVGPDYHIYIHNHAYSVSYRLVGEYVDARISAKHVQFFHLQKQVATHERDDTPGTASTNPDHRPIAHQAYANQDLQGFLDWANTVGTSAMEVVQTQFKGRPEHSLIGRKACSQLKGLAKSYGKQRFEAACARALRIASPTVKSIRSILAHRLDEADTESTAKTNQIPTHENIRGASYYEGGLDDDHATDD